ncbi:hypothetical protein FQR65_LT03087 [Abscondita terminalis]|nr:hypothetical protein FQR65_LT03087 [Abscondita terminalis]
MDIQSVLIEYENTKEKEIFTNSGLLFSKNYVLITSNVLVSHLQQFGLLEWFKKLKPGILNYNVFPIKNEPKLKVVSKNQEQFHFRNAKIVACFVCNNILTSSQKYLKDWTIDFDNKSFTVRDLLSLFFILKTVDTCKEGDNSERKNLNIALNELLISSSSPSFFSNGQDVFIESTPFGNRAFLNSYSQGVITNVLGERSCFLLSDCSSTPGSEGSPVFIKTKYKNKFAIAIVISCLNWWKGEWIGLTLAANLVPLLRELIPPSYKNINIDNQEVFGTISKELQTTLTRAIVQVVCGTGWGTGILLSKEKGIFMTNSHVIETRDDVFVYWRQHKMKAIVVYQTPNFDPFDLAILKINTREIQHLEMLPIAVHSQPVEKGQEIYAAGYPLFPRNLMLKPSLTKGYISQVHNYSLKTTATVLPGSSGGAILNSKGKLLGIIVSNSKMDEIGIIYPRVNMAVPIKAIYSTIELFLENGDYKTLQKLHSEELCVRKEWDFMSAHLRRRWFKSLVQILTPIVLFLLFSYIRANVDILEKKIDQGAVYNTECASETLYNDRFDHETIIYYTPCTTFTSNLIYQVQLKFQMNIDATKCYATEPDLLNNIEYNQSAIVAIIFKNLVSDTTPKQLDYQIRPYQEHVHWDTKHLYKLASSFTQDLGSAQYLYGGILAVQVAIESSFVEMVTNKDLPVSVLIQEFPYPPHIDKSGTMDMFNYVLPLITMLTFMFSCAMFLPQLIEDKVTGMKEFLRINGVKYRIVLTACFLDEFIINLIGTISITVFLKHRIFKDSAPIENSDFWILFSFLTLYSTSTISFCLALDSFFKKSTYSVVFALLVWVISYTVPNSLVDSNVFSMIDLVYGLLPNGLLIFGFKVLTVYEIRNTTANWNNIFEPPSGGAQELAMGYILIALAVMTVFYTSIALLVDFMISGGYTILERWTTQYVRIKIFNFREKTKKMNETEDESRTLIIEEQPNLSVSIQVRELSKQFGSNTVVNNVSIDIYDEQITVLVGKNGAGKTTLLSMITGMIKPTNGTVIYKNGDQTSIGFCPQHNLQYSSLTVEEHLNFFGKVKQFVNTNKFLKKSKELLELTNLTLKKTDLIGNLSEGMRRKLSISIALIGDSNIIILDEPSCGLDPEVRRDVWDFIIKLRGFHTVIVTTHLMEEAEVLSDQIIILDNGSITHYGTPLFLSKRCGAGYKLHISYKEESYKSITNVVGKYIGTIEYSSNSSMKVVFDKSEKEKYIQLIEELEINKNSLEIQHLDFKYTSLEEIFLNSVKKNEKKSNKLDENLNFKSSRNLNVSKCSNFFILMQKCIYFTKWRISIVQILMLFLTVLTIFFFGEFDNQIKIYNGVVEFKLSKYEATKVFFSVDDSNVLYNNIPNSYGNIIQQELGDLNKVSNVSKAIISEGIKNIEFYKTHMVVAAEFGTRSNGQSFVTAMYSNGAVHGSTISINLIFNTLLKSFSENSYSISSSLNPLPNQTANKVPYISVMQLTSVWCILLTLIMVIISGLFIIIPQVERTSNLKHLQIISGVSRSLYWFTWYIWDILLYSLVIVSALGFVYYVNNQLNVSEMFGQNETITLSIILIAFGFGILPYCYLYTYMRTRYRALAYFLVLNLLSSQLLMILTLYLETSNDIFFENLSNHITHGLNFFPVFGLQSTIAKFVKKVCWNFNWNHTSNERRDAICKSKYNPCCDDNEERCNQYKSYLYTEDPAILICVIEMFVSTFLYMFILAAVEIDVFNRLKMYLYKSKANTDRERTHSILEVSNLTKKFGNKEVVKKISFNSSAKNCVGLLGPNGAGKTTISRLLSNEELPDGGEIYRKYQRGFGYCPQSDCASSLASGKRVLELFGKLRGASENEVTRLIQTLDLNDCANKVSNKYSGGNKRKLGTAIALIGNPDLIVLDEPTANLDLISRYRMIRELESVKDRSSMIISTHITDDCESLCDRIVIVRDGEVIEEGTISQLKNNFNKHIFVKLKIKNNISKIETNPKKTKIIKSMKEWIIDESEDVKKLKERFCETIRGSNLEDQHSSLLKYSVTISSTMYNTIYREVEKLKQEYTIIEDYEITSSTLECAYLSITNEKRTMK